VVAEADDPAVDPHAGLRRERLVAAWVDTEVPQHVEAAGGPVERMGAEVEVEALAVAAAGPSADVLGSFDEGDGMAGASERGGGGQAGEPATDDDGSCVLHVNETIDSAAL
jgi:hypothetical protein